jgi:hypothetical protein
MSQRTRSNGVIALTVVVMFVALVLAALVSWMGVTTLKDGLSPDDVISTTQGMDIANVIMGALFLIGGTLGFVGVGWLAHDALREPRRHGN